MSTVNPAIAPTPAPVAPANVPDTRADVLVEDKFTVPGWINTLDQYRRWAESDDYPERGWVSYLNGAIFVDASMEEFLTHNRVKYAFNASFALLLMRDPPGCFVPDRMLLVNQKANLSTEPDGLFYRWETMQSGRLRLVQGKRSGYTQLEGTPDVVIEVVTDSSVDKDTVRLRELYWKAEIPEYWLVDARKDKIHFEIMRRCTDGYQPTTPVDAWIRSNVLAHSFHMERSLDPLGLPQFAVQFKA